MRREEDPGLLEPQSSQPRPLGHLCPSICPRSDSGTRALNIAASPGEGFRCQPGRPGPRLPAPRLPTRSAPARLLGTRWERWPYPRTLPHPPGRGEPAIDFGFSHQDVVCVPHPEGALATNNSKQGQIFVVVDVVPSASGSMGSAHCPQNGGEEETGWGFLSSRKGESQGCGAVAGLPNLPGSVSKEHHFFFVVVLFFKIFYILKKTYHAPTVNCCRLCRRPMGPQGLPV